MAEEHGKQFLGAASLGSPHPAEGFMGGGGKAQIANRSKPIEGVLDASVKTLEQLHEMLALLERRLEPVLQPQPPREREEPTMPDSDGASPLARLQVEVYRRAFVATLRIRDLIDRLEV